MKPHIIPAAGIVVCVPVNPEEIQLSGRSGIVAIQEKQPEIGKVVVVGGPAFRKRLPVDGLKPGAIIAYRKFGESKFFIAGEEYAFVDFADVLGIIRKGEK